ncbi:hypothetical protein L1987_54888 [Smallanthus sonchifolius]|uniref:Uncharacterized protein n=1 Tax=Smallanthus sonchifolius TaxID=185202 RepID=A0ACB9E804_9ASTR|nr:hypothetical protein L1987_54888 [Smallanthus sonchifolius]
MLPEAGMRAFDYVQGIVELSKRLKANHSRLEAKMKTVCAQRDDMEDKMNKYKSTDDRTIDDWFSKVKDAESLAQELETKFRKKQKRLTVIYVRSRSMLSKEIASVCLDIDNVITEGYILRNGQIFQGAFSEIQEDLKAIRAPGNMHMVYICIVVLLSSSLFVLLISLGSHMMICPSSCYDDGVYSRIARFISSPISGRRMSVCPASCYGEHILARVTRFISSIIRHSHATVCASSREEVGHVVPRVTTFISSLFSGSQETVCPTSAQYECVSSWVPKYIQKVIANIWR